MIKLGILGCGNMGGAILRGWAAGHELAGQISLYAYDKDPKACACAQGGVNIVNSEAELAREADWLLLAVKPQHMAQAVESLRAGLNGEKKLLISIAAGLGIARIKDMSGGCPVVRVMPNTPAMVGQGVFGLCFDDMDVSAEQQSWLEKLFAMLGLTLNMPEEKFDAFTAFSGGGPAYIYYLLDALVEAGVTLGFSRQEATQVVMELAKGSVALAEQTGRPMTILREQVCSPGGTTIEATNHFDRKGLRGHIVDALGLASEKGKKLG